MNNKNESIDNTYLKRRTIESGKYVEVIIKDIGHINKSTIGIVIDVAEENFLIKSPIKSNFLKLFDNLHIENINNINEIKNKKIDLIFNSNMDKCGFEIDKYNYDVEHIEGSYDFDDSLSIRETIQDMLLLKQYEDNDSDKNGLKLDIDSIDEICDNSFKLKSRTKHDLTFEWDIDIPITTEKESSEVAKLIEEEGGGKPSYLTDLGEIFIVHKDDVDKNLDFICYDRTDTWALVVPSTYKNWDIYKPSNRTKSISKKSKKSKNKPPITFGTYLSTVLPITMLILTYNMFLKPILLDMQVETEMINLLMNISELIVSLNMVIIAIYTILFAIQLSLLK